MLGGFQFSSRPHGGVAGGPAIAVAALIALAVATAALPAAADRPDAPPPPATGARVSTSPDEQTAAATLPADPGRPDHSPDDGPPLTRAAARHRIDAMSPAGWLGRYGPVSIGHRK